MFSIKTLYYITIALAHYVYHRLVSLRSWRDSGAGERAAEPPYSLAKPAKEFNSTLHQSSHGLATRASLPKQKHSRAKSRQLRRLQAGGHEETFYDGSSSNKWTQT